MIDFLSETLVRPKEAARLLPSALPGKRVHIATIHRWFLSGQLESIRVGGRWFTSREAIQRFVLASNRAPQKVIQEVSQQVKSGGTVAAMKAMRELEHMGI